MGRDSLDEAMQPITDEWFAGYFSLKGCVYVNTSKRGYAYPQIQITETDFEIAEAIAEYLRGELRSIPSANIEWSPKTSYQICKGGQGARAIMKRVRLLVTRSKREAVDHVLAKT